MGIRISAVFPGSPAEKAGIRTDELIEAINGEPVLDEIDYQALSMPAYLQVEINDGKSTRTVRIIKGDCEPLGLSLDERDAMKPRHCRNKCVFCFVDQLPKGLRDTLYVKDDDWRLSLMMGNYVTLTNVDDREFDRIIRRKASPLYISVHATDPDVRRRMLMNPNAGNILERLTVLKDHGLEFYSQIVLCPGINDGEILNQTINDLASLYPAARSVAIVPVGLTRFRENLPHLTMFDSESAGMLLDTLEPVRRRFLGEFGTRFIFPSDEFYCLSGRNIPEDEAYEDYGQIENGVGLLRSLETECKTAFEDLQLEGRPSFRPGRKLILPTGVSAHRFITELVERYGPRDCSISVVPVENHFFGKTITVTGLIVGSDLIRALKDMECDEILLTDTVLREHTDSFLDDVTLREVRSSLNWPIRLMHSNGQSLIRALWGMEDEDA